MSRNSRQKIKDDPPLEQFDFIRNIFKKRETGVILAIFFIGLFFSITSPQFIQLPNVISILRQASIIGIMTISITFLMISGEFDLSIGSIFATAPVIAVELMIMAKYPMGIAYFIGLSIGPVYGLVNGLLVTKTKVPSFIATLGTMMIFRGIALVISGGWPKSPYITNVLTILLGEGKLFNYIPVPIIWFVAISIIMWMILEKTRFGFKIFATGGNVEAARISGIKIENIKVINFVLTGLFSAFSGLITLCYMGMVAPTMGEGYELEAIASTVIGGTLLRGGTGSILGAFMGSFILAEIRNGLVLNMVDPYIHRGIIGIVIITSAIINTVIFQYKK
jgi:ribose/xylose/arabinose/galactoside ABC-type transport system permease subunit